jgi:uncharacterized protein
MLFIRHTSVGDDVPSFPRGREPRLRRSWGERCHVVRTRSICKVPGLGPRLRGDDSLGGTHHKNRTAARYRIAQRLRLRANRVHVQRVRKTIRHRHHKSQRIGATAFMKSSSRSHSNENFSRRDFMCCGALLFAGLLGAPGTASALNFKDGLNNPCEGDRAWTSAERDLIDAAFAGINASQFIDIHAHLLGTGDSGSGCHVHESLYSIWQPIEFLRRKQILSGACVKEPAGEIDRQYVSQLTRMMNDFPAGAKAALLAFDHAQDDHGAKDLDKSTFHVPNAYAKTVAQTHASRFEWIASVHPYRDDAVAAIAKARADGAVGVKWLPSAMNIDWRDARLVRVYDYLAQTQMPLIAHFGAEKAVKGAHRDEFLNPLHARVPLERGVRLIVAHAASMGSAPDLESASKRSTPCFDLFTRLMNDRSYERNLLADTSAVFFCNRDASVWQQILRNSHWHSRLLHGTDHPLPGVWPLYDMGALVAANVLDASLAPALISIRRKNAVLFDFVLKRNLRFSGSRFAESVFEVRDHLGDAKVARSDIAE